MPEDRILVVLPNWFGETLFATPFLSALRRARPGAFIAAMGVSNCQDVLAHNPSINQFILLDEQGLHRSWAGKLRLAGELRAMRFDTALVLRRSLTRSLLLWASGIRRRIGFAHWKTRLALTDHVPLPGLMHKASTYFQLFAPLGIDTRRTDSCVYVVSEQERADASMLLRQAGVDKPFIVLHPGANWTHKQWLPERFAQVANAFAATHQMVATGTPRDTFAAGIIRDRMSTPLVVLTGRTTIRQLGACLARAALIVTNDTGVLHMACALGRPAVALYGPTSPELTGPLGASSNTVLIHHDNCCPQIPCYQPVHPGFPGMSSITAEEVIAAAAQLLGAQHAPTR